PILFFSRTGSHRNLPSFPTRRSSDLLDHHEVRPDRAGPAVTHRAQALERTTRQHDYHHARRRPGATARTARAASRSAPRGSQATDRKSTRLNSSHVEISYAVFCLKKK